MRYNSSNVPPKGSINAPILDSFDRYDLNDYYTDWVHNAIVDNLEMLGASISPQYIAGCSITALGGGQYQISAGYVWGKNLVYVPAQNVTVPSTSTNYLLYVNSSTGNISYIDISSFNLTNYLNNRQVKIAYVCGSTVQYCYQQNVLNMLNIPVSKARYDTTCFYDRYAEYN